MTGEQKNREFLLDAVFEKNKTKQKTGKNEETFLFQLTVTLGEVDEAAGTGVTVLSGVVWFADATSGQILAGTVRELRLTVTG